MVWFGMIWLLIIYFFLITCDKLVAFILVQSARENRFKLSIFTFELQITLFNIGWNRVYILRQPTTTRTDLCPQAMRGASSFTDLPNSGQNTPTLQRKGQDSAVASTFSHSYVIISAVSHLYALISTVSHSYAIISAVSHLYAVISAVSHSYAIISVVSHSYAIISAVSHGRVLVLVSFSSFNIRDNNFIPRPYFNYNNNTLTNRQAVGWQAD